MAPTVAHPVVALRQRHEPHAEDVPRACTSMRARGSSAGETFSRRRACPADAGLKSTRGRHASGKCRAANVSRTSVVPCVGSLACAVAAKGGAA